MGSYQTLLVERRGPVGWIIFNRPERLNALSRAMEVELGQAWREHDDDDAVRVIVNSGIGRGFQVGVDLKEVSTAGSMANHQMLKENKGSVATRSKLTARQWNVSKPVICAVNGICAGAGFHFVTEADFAIASSNATFLEPHVSMGQVSAIEPISLLTLAPFGAVMRMLLLGSHERLSAAQAQELGLLTEVVDPPDDLAAAAQALAERIAKNSPSAIAFSRTAMWAAVDYTLGPSLERAMRLVAEFWDHPDNKEGPAAFADRRPPIWAAQTLPRG
jgi:enoyl-CoA hydratase/carnithine racemase